jgi:hypothetical protein
MKGMKGDVDLIKDIVTTMQEMQSYLMVNVT